MHECSKAISRRLHDVRFATKYFTGKGIDIGGKPDPLGQYIEFFPLISECRTWDLEDGDAQFMEGVPDESLDFVHSSHCLEHIVDPAEALVNWVRILKPGGYLVCLIPDEDLYEQGVFPSTKNPDHKSTFTLHKPASWSSHSVNIFDLLGGIPNLGVCKVELLDATYRYTMPEFDQTMTPVGESAIEIIARRRPPSEMESKGRLPKKQ